MILRIDAAELRAILRPLTKVQSDTVVFDQDCAYSLGQDAGVLVRDAKLNAEGKQATFSVEAKELFSILSPLAGLVELNSTDKGFFIKAGRAKFQLAWKTSDAGQSLFAFPPKVHIVDLKKLKDALAFVAPIPTKSALFDWSGSIQVTPQGVTATDGARIAVISTQHGPDPFLIPAACAGLVADFDAEQDTAVSVGASTVLFRNGSRHVFIRQLAKKYPNTASHWPKEIAREYRVETKAFRDSIKRVFSCVPTDDHNRITLVLNGEGIQISAKKGSGEAEDELDAELLFPDTVFEEAGQFTMNFDAQFLLDFLDRVTDAHTFVRLGKNPADTAAGPTLMVLEAGNKKTLMAPLSDQ